MRLMQVHWLLGNVFTYYIISMNASRNAGDVKVQRLVCYITCTYRGLENDFQTVSDYRAKQTQGHGKY